MKYIQALIICTTFSGCSGTKNILGAYKSICSIYHEPVVVLTLSEDSTFRYAFPYVDEKIQGKWKVIGDSLILTSDTFLKEEVPETPKTKYTDLPGGRDVYRIKGKTLLAYYRSGLKKDCYLEKVE